MVAGRALSDADDADIAIMMVEAGGSERSFQYYDEGAPQVTEEVLADGLEAAKTWIRESIVLQRKMVEAYVTARGPIETIEYSTLSDYGDDLCERVEAVGTGRPGRGQQDRGQGRAQRAPSTPPPRDHQGALSGEFPEREGEVKAAVRGLTKKLVRKRIVDEGLRIDGRTTTDIRPLSAEVDLFPTAHGSALFQRGETQVLNVTTLGHAPDEPAARHHHARRPQALHAPLQLPALLDR